MDETYDVIVLGTGLTECILSGIMTKTGKKVLHMDRNNYYGGESASMRIKDLYKLFGQELCPGDKYGNGNDWNIDLIPKYIMAHGELSKLLIYTGVDRYLEFSRIKGSYVYKREGNICEVPATDKEAVRSRLMGSFEKRRFRNFLSWITNLDVDDSSTFNGIDPDTTTMCEVFKKFGLDQNTTDFIGHSICLFLDDDYLDEPCKDAIKRFKLYYDSISSYGKSPYLYPLYGLGGLPEGFSRLGAVYGATWTLDKPVEGIIMEDGKVFGVKYQGKVAKTSMVIADPSYFPDRVTKTSKVVRAICIINHSIGSANNSSSFQVVIPANQSNRKTDIYVAVLSYENRVTAARNYNLGFVSTAVETENPEEELALGLDLLKPIEHKFIIVKDVYHPKDDGTESRIFISKSYDATSHFETICEDIKNIYERIHGEQFHFEVVGEHLGYCDM